MLALFLFSQGALPAIPVQAQTTDANVVPLIYPTTLVFDAAGSLYLAETNRHVVDKLDASGGLTVVAGNGSQGFSGDNGPAISAQLDSPQGLAIDAAGNLYIADTHNQRIRMVAAATGIISTVAGSGSAGFTGDGMRATMAQLSLPTALALDRLGHLYVADSNNHRIRRIALATGVIDTAAGNGIEGDTGDNGAAIGASIDTPAGLAVDTAGNLYLADTHNHRVRRVTRDSGMITSVAGGGTSLPGLSSIAAAANLVSPRGLSMDNTGALYVADTGGQRVLRVGADGAISSVVGAGPQGFAGDGGPAIAALLDSPHSTGISPAGLLTLADTGNGRVRQVNASGILETLGGVGVSTPGVLSLNAPSVVQYGTGSVTATLAAANATGSISFLDVSRGVAVLLGTGVMAGNAAMLSTAALPAGVYRLIATYAGDATHPSVESSVLALTIAPAPLVATPTPATVVYGQAVPVLAGILTGVLPRDADLVAAVFSTAAGTVPTPGAYPITVTLVGASAGNYQIGSLGVASLTIGQAPTMASAFVSASPLIQGSMANLSARAVSTTRGTPSGRFAFFDGGAPIGSGVLDTTGAAALPASFGLGTHTITAVYSGDTNFLASTTPPVVETIVAMPASGPDFTLAASGGASQTVTAGTSASFQFGISVQNGPLNSPILLTASGMPVGATGGFNPAYLPPGGAVSAFTLTVQTQKAATVAHVLAKPGGTWVLFLGFVAVCGLKRKRLAARLACVAFGLLAATGCGDRIAQLPSPASTTASYPMTVSATTTLPSGATLQHTVVVTLTVQ